ncbi:F-box incomplete domain containing protein [Pandoravirus neocaledonia]|uniref:F-box incomplete domain containing protein n=1 Tax=Pandoravirus neocaledonia TaxID=2107708 RepID=A0A2U7UDT6_9VIRU|nr:F-box incomplete domain containing protein [Pandoravirus neocaledonia]AVK76597.1 F-box incomplete domain containing protein [Pandoravirus neocaledonia]
MEARATIAVLPAEVLDLVFFSHGDVIDRAIVGRVCRRWRHLGRCRWRSRGHRYERPTWIDIVGACCDGRETVARWLVNESAHWHCPLGPADGWACVEAVRLCRADLVPWLRGHGARWTVYTRTKALARGYAGALDEGAADDLVMSQTDVDAIAASGDTALLQRLAMPPLCSDLDLGGIAVSAARAGHLSVLEWLVRKHAFRFPTACVYAAAMKGHAAVVRWLTDAGTPMAATVGAVMAGDVGWLVSRWGHRLDAHARKIISIVAAHGRRPTLDRIMSALPIENRHARAIVCDCAVRYMPKREVLPFLVALVDRFGSVRVVSWLAPPTVGRAIDRDLCNVVAWMIDLGCEWPWSNLSSHSLRKSPRNLVVHALTDAIDHTRAHEPFFFRALADGWKPRRSALCRALCAMAHTRAQNATRTEPSETVIRALIECGHCPWTDKARRLALAMCSIETALLALSGLEARDMAAHVESIRATHPHRHEALVAYLKASPSL